MVLSASEPGHWLGRVDRWSQAHGWASDALTGFALAAVLGVLSISGAQGMRWSMVWAVVLVISFAVLHLSVVFRRFAPVVAYASASLAMLVIVLAPDGRVAQVPGGPTHVPAMFLPSSLVFLIVIYGVAARVEVVGSRVVLAVALVGVAIATGSTADTLRQFTAGGWLVTFYVGVGLAVSVLMAWNLGRLVTVRRARASIDRAESARIAVLEERARIARETHDIVAHSLAVIVRQAEGGAFVAERDPARAVQTLQTIAETARAALTDMRGVLGVLREQREPGPSSRPTLADLEPLVAGVGDAGVHAELTASGVPFAMGATTELAVYRLVQEGLTNAVKHAGPRARVAVVLNWQPDALIVAVVDDGGEVPVPIPVPGTGAGLQGMRERVAAVGGTFDVAPGDRGFGVRACFPRLTRPSG